MNMELEVLKHITETAVKAAGMRDYTISPLKKLHVRPDGTKSEFEIEPPPAVNELFDLPSIVELCKRIGADTEVFVGKEEITVLHDETRTRGYSTCDLTVSHAVMLIQEWQDAPLHPEKFERMASLHFGADPGFINRLRKLQWKNAQEQTAKISNISKSVDATAIAQVMDENDVLYQDVSLFVKTRYFLLPYETQEFEVELQIIANAESKQICFAPVPGVMEKQLLLALCEIQGVLTHMLGKEYADKILLGKPKVA